MRRYLLAGIALIAGILLGLNAGQILLWRWRTPGEELSGGQVTVFDTTPNAFGHPAPGLPREQELLFFVGNSFFNQNWVAAPASTTARDGLGPFFNARSCAGCHFKDGRGRPPAEGQVGTGLLLRLALATEAGIGPDPTYGGQLQDVAIPDVPTEGQVRITYQEIPGQFADGTPYSLRQPIYTVADLGYGPLAAGVGLSPRVANQLAGMGLLEAVPDDTIIALADPDDANNDGISGRVHWLDDANSNGQVVGRFGWKATQPSILAQSAAAFVSDMGITSPLNPEQSCAPPQIACQQAAEGGTPEIEADDLDKVVLYVSSLSVPARRDWETLQVLQGKALFNAAGCAACHTPQLQTGEHPTLPALSNQTIYPYTDLLLHDMGAGLADAVGDGDASGAEWRTPPLWGIGLVETVNGHTFFLHDGRARNLTEAILWHGGEAEASQQFFLEMPAADREALIAFLESL